MSAQIFKYSNSKLGWNEKPTKKKIGSITNTMKDFSSTIEEFLDNVTVPNAQSWSGGRFNGKICNENWIDQQVIGLDFDSGTKQPQEVIDYFRGYGITPSIYYCTFSHQSYHPKFRIVFFLDEPITCKNQLKLIFTVMSYGLDIDTKCFNPARIFLGGTQGEIMNHSPISQELLMQAVRKMGEDYCLNVGVSGTDRDTKFSEQLYINNSSTELTTHTTTPIPRDQKIDLEALAHEVKVLENLRTGERKLHHNEVFGLITNLQYIRNGKTFMLKHMKEYDRNNEKGYNPNNYAAIEYVPKMRYHPMAVKRFSYCDEDKELDNLLNIAMKKGKVVIKEKAKKIPLAEAEKILKEQFKYVMEKKKEDDTVYIFRLPTAIGKTKILESVKNSVIAEPTNSLKNEVIMRMNSPSRMTPDPIEFMDENLNIEIKGLYTIGLPKKAMEIIYNISEGEGPSNDQEIAKTYITALKDCYSRKYNTLTTHTRALNTNPENQFPHETIIFDEDPLDTLVKVDSTTVNDISAFQWQFEGIKEVTNYFKNLPDGMYNTPTFSFNLEDLVKNVRFGNGISTNVFQFFESNSFIYKDGKINYIMRTELPIHKKVIILSATIDPDFYRKIYPEYKFEVVDITHVEQVGKVIQYTGISCSRESLKNDPKTIQDQVQETKVITFMKHKSLFPNAVKDIHFGNCAGYDTLAGQDLAVVGTPHIAPEKYYLLAKLMGVKFVYGDTPVNNQRVTYNGFEFTIKCFINEELRKIQFSSIESELLQAVGRARTLRKDCTVEVYSNFPLYVSAEFHVKKVA